MAKILIVEDDESIRNLIELTLMQFQYETVSFEDAEAAWEYLKKDHADMGIFDLMLPGMTGLELIARIREDEHLRGLPVIILTAKDSELDKVIGLDQGADDYMTKPFSVLELTARIRSLLRRSGTHHNETHSFNEEGLNIDFDGRTVHVRDHQVDFVGESRTLDVHINSLRRKLGEPYDGWIQVIRGVGYRFVQESNT